MPGQASRNMSEAGQNMAEQTDEEMNIDWQPGHNHLKRSLNSSNESINLTPKRTVKSSSYSNLLSLPSSSQNEMSGYSIKTKGPYSVWVKNITHTDKPFNIYMIGKIITGSYNSVIEVKRDGRFRGLIVFQDRTEANLSLSDEKFKQHGLITFIPNFKKMHKGIIKNIPTELSDDEIQQAIVCETNVCQVIRLTRRNPAYNVNTSDKNASDNTVVDTNVTNKWIPTTTVLVSFEGDILPKEVSLYHVLTKVSPYIRKTVQCLKCFKFHHIAKDCRGKSRCLNCGELEHPNENCQGNTPRCANCHGPHKSTSRKECNTFKKFEAINIKMAQVEA
ncbi:hypothetical protein TKK_0010069 [Trichogramma kaykai]